MPRGVPTKMLNFRANGELRRRLEFVAAERGVSVSEVIREASEDAAAKYMRAISGAGASGELTPAAAGTT